MDEGNTCATGNLSSLAAAFEVASATASPVRVAQLAFPALTRMAPASPFDNFRLRRESRTGAACTRFCVNTAAALAGMPGDDQRQIVPLYLANAGIGGGVCIS